MDLKIPKNDKYQWTQHSIFKMRQYGLSSQRVVRVIRNPERTEIGIVENTIAVMQPSSVKWKNFKKTWSQEIWAMYQLRGSGAPHPTLSQIRRGEKGKIKIISAWRYPGVSPKNNPIPEEILREISAIV